MTKHSALSITAKMIHRVLVLRSKLVCHSMSVKLWQGPVLRGYAWAWRGAHEEGVITSWNWEIYKQNFTFHDSIGREVCDQGVCRCVWWGLSLCFPDGTLSPSCVLWMGKKKIMSSCGKRRERQARRHWFSQTLSKGSWPQLWMWVPWPSCP